MVVHAGMLTLVCAPALAQDAAKATEREAGPLLFNNACRTCHTTKDGDNRLGPHLYGIIGRKAGSLPNYGYSAAMAGADIKWDRGTLDRFIADPDAVVPGHAMRPYGGVRSAQDRARLIAFLEAVGR